MRELGSQGSPAACGCVTSWLLFSLILFLWFYMPHPTFPRPALRDYPLCVIFSCALPSAYTIQSFLRKLLPNLCSNDLDFALFYNCCKRNSGASLSSLDRERCCELRLPCRVDFKSAQIKVGVVEQAPRCPQEMLPGGELN